MGAETATLSPEEMLLEIQKLLNRPALMDQKQICTYMGICATTLRSWRDEGWLPYFDEGKIKKYDPEAVLAAYKLKFGASTHYKVIELNTEKRRVS